MSNLIKWSIIAIIVIVMMIFSDYWYTNNCVDVYSFVDFYSFCEVQRNWWWLGEIMGGLCIGLLWTKVNKKGTHIDSIPRLDVTNIFKSNRDRPRLEKDLAKFYGDKAYENSLIAFSKRKEQDDQRIKRHLLDIRNETDGDHSE